MNIDIFKEGDPHIEEPWVRGGDQGVAGYKFLLRAGLSPEEASAAVVLTLGDDDCGVDFMNRLASANNFPERLAQL